MSRLLLVAVALLGVACGESSGGGDEDAGSPSGGSGAVTGGTGGGTGASAAVGGSGVVSDAPECEGIPRDTGKTPAGEDACVVVAKIRERCNPDAEATEGGLEECYASVDVARVDGCFLVLYERERETCESVDDWDYSIALAKANPQIVTPAGLACLESRAQGCDPELQGPLKECFARSAECDTFGDLCRSVYTLAPTWSSKLPECLTRPCAELESCLYDLMGTPVATRD